VVIYAGDNNLGDGRSPEQVLSYYCSPATKMERQLPGVPYTFLSVKPSLARFGMIERIRRANQLVEEEIARRPDAHFISLSEVMLRDGKPRAELFPEDGLHLSPAGHQLWAEEREPYRNTIFTPVSGSCNLVPGERGDRVVVFPTRQGRFFDNENRGLANALRERIDGGQIQLFSVDSLDSESLYSVENRPQDRIARHNQ
jgi:hypothetical protein